LLTTHLPLSVVFFAVFKKSSPPLWLHIGWQLTTHSTHTHTRTVTNLLLRTWWVGNKLLPNNCFFFFSQIVRALILFKWTFLRDSKL
jgi:hypothetical protein